MEQDLSNVKYVGPATAKRLLEHGITNVEQLAAMSVEALAALPGIGDSTAPLIIASAQQLLAAPSTEDDVTEAVQEVGTIMVDAEAVTAVEEETPAEYIVVELEPELSKKKLKKAAKKAKKEVKKALKKAKKFEKATEKAAEKARKKAAKQAKKAEEKADKKKGKSAKD